MKNIIDQLVYTYHVCENWHTKKLSYPQSEEYFIRLLSQNNIVVFMDNNILSGYIEFYRITPEQWRRIIDKEDFYAFDENITDGEICYVNAIYIYEKYRRTECIGCLKQLFFELNKGCRYFVGIDNRHNKRIRVKGAMYGRR